MEASMRCEHCGRAIRNAEMWLLASDRVAPSSLSMRTLCRTCRQSPTARAAARRSAQSILAQAVDVVRQYHARYPNWAGN